jgi:hypothetical protein
MKIKMLVGIEIKILVHLEARVTEGLRTIKIHTDYQAKTQLKEVLSIQSKTNHHRGRTRNNKSKNLSQAVSSLVPEQLSAWECLV